ncbi:hypothetical protein QYM36_006209 [Artemia franciscana]|uniref:Calponin-homology (CH) domain-containing protein n=1 Tax=Artemia franciscana TaxID=6661 RepID=A0AA88L933_ARTSF|nr:hypothetical protein QYM36_006209 [Artemia franciscana]
MSSFRHLPSRSAASTPARGIGKRWIGAALGANNDASLGWGLSAISNPELPQTEAELAQFYHERIMEAQQRHLEPLREDLADWLNRIFELEHLSSETFLNSLDDGVLVCKLARIIQEKAKEIISFTAETGDPTTLPDVTKSRRTSVEESKVIAAKTVPMKKIKCWERAPRKSFFSRENACNFLDFCRNLGINESVLFESEGLGELLYGFLLVRMTDCNPPLPYFKGFSHLFLCMYFKVVIFLAGGGGL